MNKTFVSITMLIATFGLIVLVPVTGQAMSIYSPANPYWNESHWVTLNKTIKVFKIRNIDPQVNSYKVATYTVKKGDHFKLFHSAINVAWGLDSGRFNTGHQYTFEVDQSENNHSWFEFGIH
ncbi:hypothetical protein [Lentilactobacillus hilgardii]|uniref:Uncharacterized protein n=1 Tax=Lentilactobacillus hilgardii (strain ATCC 8290 / DSM 20176 / CCUG 30140 / JCM 1155 / KCTC 3500 / NBRC 15886 / NCIMB 8040 / NRRL B-1843 / 9) TaxID=1423757 RepID=C0XK17_LENH9|nr:hypothetical protein [Lentilactobacillus hilgardii]EEI24285.1 hypothetical protein HMPREF0519_1578 [Lentilactobacillus hilgardii DSM 20176 = ATCC 8290]MCP9332806.1 hypothetical protein [Lentilactobacillus hilgardii]MCP9349445.1 hypothetical protein [Lentilactobacillus hilgardii]MCP9352283.1 hypothetical protein [Lentilactobacillus hilgardii]QEU37903.1 hypothetical protein LH500_02540 [Lentilactobacillus hilgardii]